MARFKLSGKTYTTAALDEVSLRDLMAFEQGAADEGIRDSITGQSVKWSDIERIAEESSKLKKDERHPDTLLMVGVTIWASRRVAGEKITFGEAIDFPLSEIEWVPEPEDHKVPTSAQKGGKKKSATSASSTQGSPQAAVRAVADEDEAQAV